MIDELSRATENRTRETGSVPGLRPQVSEGSLRTNSSHAPSAAPREMGNQATSGGQQFGMSQAGRTVIASTSRKHSEMTSCAFGLVRSIPRLAAEHSE